MISIIALTWVWWAIITIAIVLIINKIGVIMAEIDDLKAADVAIKQAIADVLVLVTGLQTKITDLQNQLAANVPINPADVETIAQDLNSMAQSLEGVAKPAV